MSAGVELRVSGRAYRTKWSPRTYTVSASRPIPDTKTAEHWTAGVVYRAPSGWIVRDPDDVLIVSSGDACPTRWEALYVAERRVTAPGEPLACSYCLHTVERTAAGVVDAGTRRRHHHPVPWDVVPSAVARALDVDPAVIVSPATVELLGRLRELVEKHAPTDAELDEGGDLWHGLRGALDALDRWARS